MKKLIFIISIILLGCTDKRFELIADYEQNIFDTHIDLSFKGLEYNEIGPVYASDSLEMFRPLFDNEITDKLEYLENNSSFYSDMLGMAKYKYKTAKHPEMRLHYKQQIKEYESKAREENERMQELIQIYTTDCKSTYLETIKEMIDKWESDTSKLLGWRVEAKYQIRNPLLNTEQQLTKEYLLAPDKSKVIAATSNKSLEEIFINLYDKIM
jgi:hypothetical protein